MPDARLARIESALHRAWTALYFAAVEAESYSNQSLADDLHQLTAEISRLEKSLLRRS